MIMFVLFAIIFSLIKPVFATDIPISFLLEMSYRPVPANYQSIPEPVTLPVSASATSPPLPSPSPVLKEVKIALLGDSMMDTLGTDFPALTKILKLHYPNLRPTILNYGYGSSTLKDTISRLGTSYTYRGKTYPDLFQQNPDLVVIESHAYNNYGNTKDGYNQHWLELATLTTTLQNKLPNTNIIILSTLSPNSLVFDTKDTSLTAMTKIEKTRTIKTYLQKTISFARSEGYIYVDASTPTLRPDNEGNTTYIDSDGIHPNSAGAELIASLLTSSIVENKLVDLP